MAVIRRYCACITQCITRLHAITRATTSVPGLYSDDYAVISLHRTHTNSHCSQANSHIYSAPKNDHIVVFVYIVNILRVPGTTSLPPVDGKITLLYVRKCGCMSHVHTSAMRIFCETSLELDPQKVCTAKNWRYTVSA